MGRRTARSRLTPGIAGLACLALIVAALAVVPPAAASSSQFDPYGRLVARTDQEYIDLAVKLGQDAGYRDRIRQSIKASRHLAFDDLAPIRALETFLLDVARRT